VSATVEHDKRKREILEKSLDVFIDEGYADTTLQKIADRCGITRTILYLYFHNKREIFTFSIKRFTERLETELKALAADEKLHAWDKLGAVSEHVIRQCMNNAKLLVVIIDYLSHLKRSGGETYERVLRRTIRMRHIVSGIVIAGQKKGELKKMPVAPISNLILAMVESTIFRVAILDRAEADDSIEAVKIFLATLKA